jgi:hypothetical protein
MFALFGKGEQERTPCGINQGTKNLETTEVSDASAHALPG